MKPTQEIKKHKLPCGPVTVSTDSVCRRRLHDHFDSLLDRLTQETHPEGVDKNLLEMEEQVRDDEGQETPEDKKSRMIEEGKIKADSKREIAKYASTLEDEEEESIQQKRDRLMSDGKLKADVKREIARYEESLQPNPNEEEVEETPDEKKREMIANGKFKADVKKVVKNYEDKIMGNSKMSQSTSGKIKKR